VLVRGGVTEVSIRGWVAIVLLLFLTGLGAHGFIVYAQRHVPVATIGILQVAQPALAVVWAFVILGEPSAPPGGRHAPGGAGPGAVHPAEQPSILGARTRRLRARSPRASR
jgi:hypothetical protein